MRSNQRWSVVVCLLVLIWSKSFAQDGPSAPPTSPDVETPTGTPSGLEVAVAVPEIPSVSELIPSATPSGSESPSSPGSTTPNPSVHPSGSHSPTTAESSIPSATPSGSFGPSQRPSPAPIFGTLSPSHSLNPSLSSPPSSSPSPAPSTSPRPSPFPSLSKSPSLSLFPSRSIAPSENPTTSPSLVPSFVPSITSIPSGSSPPSSTPSSSPSQANVTSAGTCAGFIESSNSYSASTGPYPIFCENQTFSRWGPPEHQSSSCCTDEGRYEAQLAQIGGFDVKFKGDQVSGVGVTYRCLAYTEALRATLCDPLQGQNVVRTPEGESYFRICKSSCDAVFEQCGLPGINYPDNANYADGTSMCLAAWNGWENESCPSSRNKKLFPCTLTGLEVFDDTLQAKDLLANNPKSCQSIILPSGDTLDVYKQTRQPPDACRPVEPSTIGIFVVVIVVVIVSLTVCGTLIYLNARHRQAEEDFS